MLYNILVRIGRTLVGRFLLPGVLFRYSQFGEDVIIAHLFAQLGITKPNYLDIGANEPKFISNTYYFYERGSRGVLIEPNPYLFNRLQRVRPGDIVLNMGVGLNETAEADFYVFPAYCNGMSTFSKLEATHWQEVGLKGVGKIKIEKVLKIKLIPVNTIFNTYFSDKQLNLLSIDVEGLDLDILKSMDFEKYRPDVICVETLKYDNQQNGYKNTPIIDFMLARRYTVYADTRVNTIFCRNELLNK